MSDDLVRRLRESGSRSEVELHEDREDAADHIKELEAKLKKAVRLMGLSVELATWNTTLLDDVIYFITELEGETDE